MKIPMFQIDAFADRVFEGNPAAVCFLPYWISEETMQRIAMENNLSETAFFVKNGDEYDIRWFTPLSEVDLCGHATLATAFCIFQYYQKNAKEIIFNTRKKGSLRVTREAEDIILDFPLASVQTVQPPDILVTALGKAPQEIYEGDNLYLAIYEDKNDVLSISPDFQTLVQVKRHGIIISAPGSDVDFVSRFFAPRLGVNEDPVTGAAHTILTPYWAKRLQKSDLTAQQLSKRGGFLKCRLGVDRVYISGRAKRYLEGTIEIESEGVGREQ